MPNMGASIGQFHASEDRTGWASCSVRTLTLKAIIFRANLPKSKAKRLSKLIKGTSNNCHRSSGAPNLPANDSALFSFRFCAVHPKDVRDCQLRQLFEVPIILASQFRVLNDSVLDHFMKQNTSQSENDPIADSGYPLHTRRYP